MSHSKTQFELPLLESIQVASPCSADWNQMQGDDRVRFCGECRQNVFNLSAMQRAEAETLIRQHTGRVCVRFFRRADGTVLTADCPVGLARIRQRIARITMISVATAASLLFGTLTACGYALGIFPRSGGTAGSIFSTSHPAPPVMGKMMMGDICPPPPSPNPGLNTLPTGNE